MKPTNIIIDCERMKHPFTGLFTYCNQLSEALVRNCNNKNLDLVFYVPASKKDLFGQEQTYIVQKSLHKILNPFHRLPGVWHCTYQGSKYFSFHKNQKKLLTIHDLNFMHDGGKSPQKKAVLLNSLQQKVDECDYISTISQYTADFLARYIDIKQKPLTVIYNGCDVDINSVVPLKPLFIKEDISFLFSIGTIARKKNFHVLPALLQGNNRYLIIAGITQDEVYLKEITTRAEELGVRDRLILPGAITEAEKWWLMQKMDAFLFPSLAEGFGIPLVEAMHFSAPVICATCTSLPEIGGAAAYYFSGFEGEEMRHCVEDAIKDFDSDSFLKVKMNERAKSFSWDESAKAYLEIYQRLANKE